MSFQDMLLQCHLNIISMIISTLNVEHIVKVLEKHSYKEGASLWCIYSDSIWALHAFNLMGESMVKYAQKNPIQVQKSANGRNKASQVCENFAHWFLKLYECIKCDMNIFFKVWYLIMTLYFMYFQHTLQKMCNVPLIEKYTFLVFWITNQENHDHGALPNNLGYTLSSPKYEFNFSFY